jgi:phage recombination protein Bet
VPKMTTANIDNDRYILTQGQIQTLIKTRKLPYDAPECYLRLFAETAKRQKLDPFNNEIFLTGFKPRNSDKKVFAVLTGIAAMKRKVGGFFAGEDDVKYNLKSDGSYKTIADLKAMGKETKPVSATLTIYRVVGGVRCPYTKTLLFSEYNTGRSLWKTNPYTMIHKCALAHLLRDAFGDLVGNMYVEEELGSISEEAATQAMKELADEMNVDISSVGSEPVNNVPSEQENSQSLFESIPLDQRKFIRGIIEGCQDRATIKSLYLENPEWQKKPSVLNTFVIEVIEAHAKTLPSDNIKVAQKPKDLFNQ